MQMASSVHTSLNDYDYGSTPLYINKDNQSVTNVDISCINNYTIKREEVSINY